MHVHTYDARKASGLRQARLGIARSGLIVTPDNDHIEWMIDPRTGRYMERTFPAATVTTIGGS